MNYVWCPTLESHRGNIVGRQSSYMVDGCAHNTHTHTHTHTHKHGHTLTHTHTSKSTHKHTQKAGTITSAPTVNKAGRGWLCPISRRDVTFSSEKHTVNRRKKKIDATNKAQTQRRERCGPRRPVSPVTRGGLYPTRAPLEVVVLC